MKTWLARFRASVELDAGDSQRQKPWDESKPEETDQGVGSMRALDRQLRAAQPTSPVPTALHASVMRAVRAATDSQERQSAPRVLRWLWAPAALAVLVAFDLWLSSSRSPHESPSMTVAAIALEQGQEMAQKAPEVVLAPLSQEMNNLNRDFQNAVDFLVASVP